MRKFLIVFMTFFLTDIAYAACAPNYCQDVLITDLYLKANGSVYINTNGDQSLLDCTLHAGVYIVLPSSAGNFEAVYSTLLAAQIADQAVMLRIDNGSSPCSLQYMRIIK